MNNVGEGFNSCHWRFKETIIYYLSAAHHESILALLLGGKRKKTFFLHHTLHFVPLQSIRRCNLVLIAGQNCWATYEWCSGRTNHFCPKNRRRLLFITVFVPCPAERAVKDFPSSRRIRLLDKTSQCISCCSAFFQLSSSRVCQKSLCVEPPGKVQCACHRNPFLGSTRRTKCLGTAARSHEPQVGGHAVILEPYLGKRVRLRRQGRFILAHDNKGSVGCPSAHCSPRISADCMPIC